MRWSRLFIPTLRDDPAEAQAANHRLLLRAGYVRQVSAGVYTHLFLARRSLARIEAVVRREMDAGGGQEMRAGGDARLEQYGRELREKQLPQLWYQIRTKRDENARPSSGLVSLREYTVAEACGFGGRAEIPRRILDRCKLPFVASDDGRLLVKSEAGEDWLAVCPQCGSPRSVAAPPLAPDPPGDLSPEPFHTPGRKTIADVSVFTGLPETSQMKSLVMVAGGALILALVRGDHQLSEAKLASAAGALRIRPADAAEIRQAFGADAGSLGPVGMAGLRIFADRALEGRCNMIAGANRDDYHLRNVTPGEDFEAEFADLRQPGAGEACANCGALLEAARYIEVARTHAAAGIAVCSLGIERILASAVELHSDPNGIRLPASIAPFHVVVTPVNNANAAQMEAAERIYADLTRAGIDTLLDDRDERPGVKFKDADLIGIPFRITIGKKLAQGIVELSGRFETAPIDLPETEAVPTLNARLD